jgi:hypothetical protein
MKPPENFIGAFAAVIYPGAVHRPVDIFSKSFATACGKSPFMDVMLAYLFTTMTIALIFGASSLDRQNQFTCRAKSGHFAPRCYSKDSR